MKPRRMQLSRQAGFNLQSASRELNGEARDPTRPLGQSIHHRGDGGAVWA